MRYEAVLIGMLADKVLDWIEDETKFKGAGSRLERYKVRHRAVMNNGIFEGCRLKDLPDEYFISCVWNSRDKVTGIKRRVLDKEYQRRMKERNDRLVEKFYGEIRRRKWEEVEYQAMMRYYGKARSRAADRPRPAK